MNEKLKASDIIGGYCSTVIRTRCQNKVYPNTYVGSCECDVLEVTKSGYTYEYEVKISRSDFKADKLKQKRSENKYDVLKAGKRAALAGLAARLCLKSETLAKYAGTQFPEIYEGIITK